MKFYDQGHRMVGGGASEEWCLRRGWGEAVLICTHIRIIDRLKPTGDWKIVVRGVSSICEFSRSG